MWVRVAAGPADRSLAGMQGMVGNGVRFAGGKASLAAYNQNTSLAFIASSPNIGS